MPETINQEELETIEEQPHTETKEEASVEEAETEETGSEEQTSTEEKPKEEEEDFYTPEQEEKPQRTELEKAEFTLKSVTQRVKDLGGDPSTIVETGEKPVDTTNFVTKRDFAESEARKLSKSPKETAAIMAWVDKGLSVTDAHLLANKGRIKETFAEMERSNVAVKEATGAGQTQQAPTAPEPNAVQLKQWQTAKMVYDPKTKTAKGKFTEEFWTGTAWESRRIK